MSRPFKRISIIGLGLIGGSIAHGLRKYQVAETIAGYDANPLATQYAQSQGIIQHAVTDIAAAVQDSELVILATPPAAMEYIAQCMAAGLSPGTIVMDTASVKRAVMRMVAPHLPSSVEFMPAHPIAGSEQSGIRAGHADLFYRRQVIVTPSDAQMTDSLKRVTAFWKALGARIEGMPADMHDIIFAYVSHLPHLLSYVARQVVRPTGEATIVLDKFLRLSKSNPDLWGELFYLNQDNLMAALGRYIDATQHIERELAQTPEAEDSPDATTDKEYARSVLFPRVAASCLITTVMEAEKSAGVPFARFAGSGFMDFTAPSALPPDSDIERISGLHAEMCAILAEYNALLKRAYDLLARGECQQLMQVLAKAA